MNKKVKIVVNESGKFLKLKILNDGFIVNKNFGLNYGRIKKFFFMQIKFTLGNFFLKTLKKNL